jgi:3-dehydroquinate dehydratase-2
MTKILVLHGPNLNLLGSREPEVYGSDTLASIDQALTQMGAQNDIEVETFQSNNEATLIDRIQQAGFDQTRFIIINPAAFTHTSVAIRDAFLASKVSFIEVHLSNVYAREDFRKHSYLSDIAIGVISGFGKDSYLLALEAAISQCTQSNLNP